MKKKFLLAVLACMVSQVSMAKPIEAKTQIINSGSIPLKFIVTQHKSIMLKPKKATWTMQTKKTELVKLRPNEESNSVYIRVEDPSNPDKTAFFSIEVKELAKVTFHPYASKLIAYSWRNGEDSAIAFCSPEDYVAHNSCFF